MDKSPAVLSIESLSGNQVRYENRASHEGIEELMIDSDSVHFESILLFMGNSRDFGNRVRAIPRETAKREPEEMSAQRPTSEQVQSGSGKPDSENTTFVYTYSVGRAH